MLRVEKLGNEKALSKRKLVSVVCSLLSLGILYFIYQFGECFKTLNGSIAADGSKLFQCPTFEKVEGASYESLTEILSNESIINETIAKLQNAVRIPTEITDDHPNPSENKDIELYKPFYKMHKQLAKDFPLVWSHLDVQVINEFSLIITWKGSDIDLKPLMFASHMDVVPVERKTWSTWEHPPFSGDIVYDSDRLLDSTLWGRGSFDDKNMMIGELQALELLVKQGFEPKRTIIVAIGSDEEASGAYGAASMNEVLVEKYGDDGIYAIVDEGLNGIKSQEGVFIASPGTAEKGFINFWVHLNTPGGHSSVPPDHTSIGIISSLVKSMEEKKFPMHFTEKNPVSGWYQCAAQYSTEMSPSLRYDFLNAHNDEKSNARVLKYLLETGGKKVEYLLRTSQAVDIINGGFKANALPETVSILVNSRVALESTVEETMNKFLEQISAIAKENELGLEYQGTQYLEKTEHGFFSVKLDIGKDPVLSSPNNEVWKLFAGSIKSLYEDVIFPEKFEESKELIIAPTIMSGNTDCLNYLSLTQNIYRYQPGFAHDDTIGTIHSVNEHVDFETVMNSVAFVYHYIHAVQQD